MNVKFYRCRHCGNIVSHLVDSGVRVVCCGEPMTELVPNVSDGAGEKHTPVISVNGNVVTVTVSTVEHPMADAHYIQWIALETEQGLFYKHLKPGQKPVAEFALTESDKPVAAYEYCNLHGLWATSM